MLGGCSGTSHQYVGDVPVAGATSVKKHLPSRRALAIAIIIIHANERLRAAAYEKACLKGVRQRERESRNDDLEVDLSPAHCVGRFCRCRRARLATCRRLRFPRSISPSWLRVQLFSFSSRLRGRIQLLSLAWLAIIADRISPQRASQTGLSTCCTAGRRWLYSFLPLAERPSM